MKKEKIKKYSFPAILFGLTIFCIFLSFDGSFTIQSIFYVILLALLYFCINKSRKIQLLKEGKYLFLLNLVYLISLLFNSILHGIEFYSIIQILYHIFIFIWFILMTQNDFSKKELRFFVDGIVLFSVISAIIILIGNLSGKTAFFSIETIWGITMNKNHFAVWISLGVILSFYCILYSSNKFRYIASFLIVIVSMLFMNSRGAILSTAICCLLIFFQFFFSKGYKFKKVMLVLLVIISAILLYKPLIRITPRWLYNRYFVNSYQDSSNIDRISRWENGIDGLLNSPIIGYGPGIFITIPKYQVTDYGRQIPSSTPTHNTFLDVAIDGGIIGLILFLVFIFSSFHKVIFKYKIYYPLLIHFIINSMILGMGKTVYFWNMIIFIILLSKYSENSKDNNIFTGGINHNERI